MTFIVQGTQGGDNGKELIVARRSAIPGGGSYDPPHIIVVRRVNHWTALLSYPGNSIPVTCLPQAAVPRRDAVAVEHNAAVDNVAHRCTIPFILPTVILPRI